MKKIIIAFVTMLMLAGSYEAKSQNAGISFNTFYDELSPYGRWVNYPDYGQVWISNENGFEPYSTNGHWDYTNYGWMWVSDYNWGWAPFHYGRWAYLNNYGWAWVPGYEWAPAWVGWCNYDGYYGWAPLSPGLGFNYSFGSIPVNYWRFVRPQYINDPYVYRHYQRPVQNVNQYNNVTVINNTVINNNVTYVPGPPQQDIERVTNKKIEPKQVAFNDNGTRKTEVLNNKKEIRVFRPDEKANITATQNTIQPKQQQVVKPAVENDNQPQASQTSAQQKQELIKQKQAPQNQVNADNNNRKQQVPQTQIREIKKQQVQQDEINAQQQNQAAIKQQEIIRRQQQQEVVRQQEAVRQQQQNEARQQNEVRQQNQIRQQRTQQPQMKQQQWNQPGIQREPVQVPQRPVKPTRKG